MRWTTQTTALIALSLLLAAGCDDRQRPEFPEDAELGAVQMDDRLQISWPAAEDASGIAEYVVTAENEEVARVPGDQHLVDITGVRGPDELPVAVQPIDEAGNEGERLFKDVEVTDNVPPTFPEDASLSVRTQRLDRERWIEMVDNPEVEAPPAPMVINWTRATDNVAVTSYRVYHNGELLESVDEDTTRITPRIDGPDGTYTVAAVDEQGNETEFVPPQAFNLREYIELEIIDAEGG